MVRSFSSVALLTLISRIFGLIRTMLLASFLGTSFVADAFHIAYKLPNLLRRFVGENSMSMVFIPVFSSIGVQEGKKEEQLFINRIFTIVALLLIFLCLAGVLFAPLLLKIFYSFGDKSAETAVFFTRYMFSYLFFIGMASMLQGVLNSKKYFALSAATPVMLNIMIITSVFLFTGLIPDRLVEYFMPDTFAAISSDPVKIGTIKSGLAFATGVVIGGAIQFLMQIPLFLRIGYSYKPSINMQDKSVREVGRLMLPGLFALGIYQINAIVADPFALAYLQDGAIAALSYSNRILEFTLGIFVVSVSTVMLPDLSKYWAAGNIENFSRMFRQAVNSVIFISIPATFGLIILRDSMIPLLLRGGLFNNDSIDMVSKAVLFHSLGLLGVSVYRILSSTFYAMKNPRIIYKAAKISLFVNITACATLPLIMGISGIAFASSLSSWSLTFYLMGKLPENIVQEKIRFFMRTTVKSVFAGLVMSLFIIVLKKLFFQNISAKYMHLIYITVSTILGSAVYFTTAWIIKAEEMQIVVGILKRKLKKN